MKSKLPGSIFFLLAINFCKAQDSAVVLSTSMFDKYFQTISLTSLSGWIFKKGNDTNWAEKEIDTKGWIKFKPSQLTAKNANEKGVLEGWFRLRFKLDSSFENINIGIEASRWAATDIYIDGKYITSYGNTGLNGKPFEENRNLFIDIRPLQIETGREHILAVHVVDYLAPLNPRFLKTECLFTSFSSLVVLTGPSAYKNATGFTRDANGYNFLFSGVIGFFSVLFWFLYLQNKHDKNILLISISTSFFFIWPLLITVSSVYPFDLDFNRWWLILFIGLEFWPIAIASMIYTVGEIFRFKHKKALVIYGVLFVISSLVIQFLNVEDPAVNPFPLTALILLLYITVSSWKRLKGAQWAIVAGIISTTIFSFLWTYFLHYYQSIPFPHIYFYQSGMCLSLPLSLMIYVAMRFKEIITEVQINAKQVIQLSEEKKEQALKQQKILEEEVARQTIELRTSLENLKSTQSQLIQSEKMASLGELTAGIAHEIQNPLNFVNNFSEVNNELIEEMVDEIKKGNQKEAEAIANNIRQNLEKINNHGRRADSIVKGMLQHSRMSSGQKELTDINALCDEYLRLSYHGLRAKDKSFNAGFETNFDPSAGKIKVVPQDIGRVLLNLYNNAFYAVTEKVKTAGNNYEPRIIVGTKKINDKIEIMVKDNGNGIPQKALNKIFLPFFTTKPAGQGTGLGLSLAYDIVKAHRGEIKVDTKEGEGTAFIIQLNSIY